VADLGSLLGGVGIGGAIGQAIVRLELDTSKYQAELKGAEAQTVAGTNAMGQSTSKFGSIAQTALIGAGAAVVAFGAYSVKAFIESEKVMAQTEAVLKSTGGAANVTKDQVLGLADQLRDLSGVDNDVIQSSENLLLTFRDVKNEVGEGNDIFNQTEKAVLDMATAMNQGAIPSQEQLKTTTIQLGKAMNNPIQGMSALRRVGVSFTEAQVAVITKMQESGDLMGAQKLILAELSKEFGGAAKAAGGTFAGQMGKLQSKFNDVAEALGEALMPAIEGFANSLLVLLPILEKVAQAMAFLPLVQMGEDFDSNASGIVKFGDALIDTIPVLGHFVSLAGEGVDEATGQGSKGLGNFRGRAFEAQQAAAGLGDEVVKTGRHIAEFADKTGKELKEWRQDVGESIDGYIFDLKNLSHRVEITKQDFVEGHRAMEDRARKMAHALEDIREENWINEKYLAFLFEQGPEAIITFEKLNDDKQKAMQQAWKRTSEFTDEAHGAVRKMSDTLAELDRTNTHHRVTIEYEYVGFDPSKPGMNVSRPVP
jgi:hypothetical protein